MIGNEYSPYLIVPLPPSASSREKSVAEDGFMEARGWEAGGGPVLLQGYQGLLIFAAKSLTLEPCTQVLLTSHADGF